MSLPIGAIFTGISTLEKIIPVVEEVAQEMGPIVRAEIADGTTIWADVEKAIADLRTAFAAVKSATAQASQAAK
jgi:hypothetical protein